MRMAVIMEPVNRPEVIIGVRPELPQPTSRKQMLGEVQSTLLFVKIFVVKEVFRKDNPLFYFFPFL